MDQLSIQTSTPGDDTASRRAAPFRILVVIDPGKDERAALDKAALIAASLGGSIELYACDVDEALPDSWAGGSSLRAYREIRQQRQLQELNRLAEPLRSRGLKVECAWEWHAPLEQGIGHHVIRSLPDLVIKTTHHHTALPRGIVGHTDWNLISQLPVPLLLVHPMPWSASVRIAAAVDPCHPAHQPSSLAVAILDQARALTNVSGGLLDVFHVLQMPPHLPGEVVPAERKAMVHAQARDAVAQLAPDATVQLAEGAVVEGLLNLIAGHRPDVLVMGSVARPRSAHSPAGGTAARILECADCDLLVVKSPGFVSPLLVTD